MGCADDPSNAPVADPGLPPPESSGIEHVILVMMENRSFDHLLGWLPGADGRQAGLTYTDLNGVSHPTFPLAPDFQGCTWRNPDNSYAAGRIEYNNGACDGWLQVNDVFSIGYYRQEDLPFLGSAAVDWMTFDRYFCPMMTQTGANRLYQLCAQSDRINNTGQPFTLPSIVDRMNAQGLEVKDYVSNVLGWSTNYASIATPIAAFYADCAAGTLPPFSLVDPPYSGGTRLGADDHPFADIRAGETFLNQVYTAVTNSPAWPNIILFINFDEWGGFFDHVAPPYGAIPDTDRAAGSDGLLGFRVPALLISPFARRRYTSHVVYDHTSLLRLIEWRWGLAPLTVRDATANNPAAELDFESPDLAAPTYSVPDVTTVLCPATT